MSFRAISPSRSSTMKAGAVLLLMAVLASTAFGVAGCGDRPAVETTSTASDEGGTTQPAAPDPSSAVGAESGGTELGRAVGATWAEAVQKLNGLLAGLPPVENVEDKIAALKEEYVQKLVAFGARRQSLAAGDKAEVDAATVSALAAAADTTWYATYMNNYDTYAYMSGDVDFVNLLASFNVLTQYADFELLKSQLPQEAVRLGVE